MLYYEDLKTGSVYQSSSYGIDLDEMIAFAERYDPQPYHLYESTRDHLLFGGVIASGWLTAAVVMRLSVEALYGQAATLGSPGVEELKWLLPVRPGDELTVKLTLGEKRVSRSRPKMGIVHIETEAVNQRDDKVFYSKSVGLFSRRTEDA